MNDRKQNPPHDAENRGVSDNSAAQGGSTRHEAANAQKVAHEKVIREVMAKCFRSWWDRSEWRATAGIKEQTIAMDAFAEGMVAMATIDDELRAKLPEGTHRFDPKSPSRDCSCGWRAADPVRATVKGAREAWEDHARQQDRFYRPAEPVRLKRALTLGDLENEKGAVTLLVRMTASQRMALATVISSYMMVPDSIEQFVDCSTSPATETKIEVLLQLLMDPERVMVVTAAGGVLP